MSSVFTVISLNTWKGEGDYESRLGWMADGLLALRPDVVFLQEAFECIDCNADTATIMANALDLHPTSFKARQKDRRVKGQYLPSWSNLAILTPGAPTETGSFKLADHTQDQDRWGIYVDIEVNGCPMRLLNTHFTHFHDEEGQQVRVQQAEQVAREVLACQKELVIFGGDLNASQETKPFQVLFEINNFLSLDDVTPTSTMQGERFNPKAPPHKRIDFLFGRASEPSLHRHMTVRESIAMNRPVGSTGEFPSDHAAVVLTMTGLGQE
ncbi:MAG: endonuclease/exonuclease/phosphatase family protein [Pseudomonadota bacterium]